MVSPAGIQTYLITASIYLVSRVRRFLAPSYGDISLKRYSISNSYALLIRLSLIHPEFKPLHLMISYVRY